VSHGCHHTCVRAMRTVPLKLSLSLVFLAVGCDRDPVDIPSNSILPPPVAIEASSSDAASASDPEPASSGAAALRRGYGPVDMKLSPCVSLLDDHTLVGKQCPSGAVVFGPYVNAPAEADVDVAFELETKTPLVMAADMVSKSAQQFHGSLLEQQIDPGATRPFGYRVHLFKSVAGLESRIFVRASTPADFKIHSLVVTVR
jgi:hypothetical protein